MARTIDTLLRRDRRVTGAGLALIGLLAWAWLLAGAGMGMSAADMTRMVYGDHSAMSPDFMASPRWTLAYWLLMFSMWWVMMTAMMLPSAAPVILLAAAIGRRAAPARSPYGSTQAFLAGYLLAWGVFSLLATAAQRALEQYGLLSGMTMASTRRWLGAALLMAAGLWQFTPWKQACLRHCRSPVEFLVQRRGRGALRMGLEHGAYCLGCCWLLMGLLFVGGAMNLFWIAGLAAIVLAEKLLPRGPIAGRVLGALLIAAGVTALVGPASAHALHTAVVPVGAVSTAAVHPGTGHRGLP